MRVRIHGKPEKLGNILDRALAQSDERAGRHNVSDKELDAGWRRFQRVKARALGWPDPHPGDGEL